jgi:hypothetical protein
MFVSAAAAKLMSIDTFEIYVFSFQMLPLWGAYLAARLLIAFEAFLGVWMLINCDAKAAWWTGMVLLAAFTVRTLVLQLAGNDGDCNCFGEFIKFTPTQSILKNIVLLAVLGISYGCKSFEIKHKWIWRTVVPVAALAAVFIISPPDNLRYKDYAKYTTINTEAFQDARESGEIPARAFEGDKILCFYSLKCRFCRMSAEKLGTLRRMHSFSEAPIIVAFGGNERDASYYFNETKLDCTDWFFISPTTFLRITNGDMPLILVLKDGEVVQKYSYRDLH